METVTLEAKLPLYGQSVDVECVVDYDDDSQSIETVYILDSRGGRWLTVDAGELHSDQYDALFEQVAALLVTP
jgi:hypothetical protein